jgi:hypothetical protein
LLFLNNPKKLLSKVDYDLELQMKTHIGYVKAPSQKFFIAYKLLLSKVDYDLEPQLEIYDTKYSFHLKSLGNDRSHYIHRGI